MESLAQMEIKDQQDPTEQEDLLEGLVDLVKKDGKVLMDQLEEQDLEVIKAHRVMKVSLALKVPQDVMDRAEILDQLEKKVKLEQSVEMAAKGDKVQVANKAPAAPLEGLVRMEKLVSEVLQAGRVQVDAKAQEELLELKAE